MKHNWDAAIQHILEWEGGYVNHPEDPGGRTNLGVTQRVWEAWTGKPVTEADMRALTIEGVKPLYKQRYWNAVRGDALPSGVDLSVFDFAVNAGPGRASRALQQLVGVAADGVIGPKTLAAAAAKPAAQLITDYADVREAFYKTLPTYDTFGKGWMRRVKGIEAESQRLA
jgi:lysozyme family protein